MFWKQKGSNSTGSGTWDLICRVCDNGYWKDVLIWWGVASIPLPGVILVKKLSWGWGLLVLCLSLAAGMYLRSLANSLQRCDRHPNGGSYVLPNVLAGPVGRLVAWLQDKKRWASPYRATVAFFPEGLDGEREADSRSLHIRKCPFNVDDHVVVDLRVYDAPDDENYKLAAMTLTSRNPQYGRRYALGAFLADGVYNMQFAETDMIRLEGSQVADERDVQAILVEQKWEEGFGHLLRIRYKDAQTLTRIWNDHCRLR